MGLLVLLPHLLWLLSKVTDEQGSSFFSDTVLPLANAPPFLSLLQSSAGGKDKQNTSFLFETPPREVSPEPVPRRGSSQLPSQEVLQVGQAQLREGLPACPTLGLGSALGGHTAVKGDTSQFGFYQLLAPALRQFSLLSSAQADFELF